MVLARSRACFMSGQSGFARSFRPRSIISGRTSWDSASRLARSVFGFFPELGVFFFIPD